MSFNYYDYKTISSLCDDGYAHDKLTGEKYECDSCPEVWENIYCRLYKKSKLSKIFGNFDDIIVENNRILAKALKGGTEFARYTIAGDTDFNMEFKNMLQFNIYCDKNNINDEVKNELLKMYQYKYCPENFSLLLTTGGLGSLQILKGTINGECSKFGRSDNVCMFIYMLNNKFYKGVKNEENELFRKVNLGYKDINKNEQANKIAKAIICSYLNEFYDIYDYCEEIYKIDATLVSEILKFAQRDYKSDYDAGIRDYIKLIKQIWESKRKFLENN